MSAVLDAPPAYGSHGPRLTALSTRFWARVDRRDGPDACWPWTGKPEANGYCKVGVKTIIGWRGMWVHRVAYMLTFGPVPEGMDVCHRCDNPPCCNPAHLFVGTRLDNVLDAKAKGRLRWKPDHAFRIHPERQMRGEHHYAARLTESSVRAIRAAVAAGESQSAVARRIGVHLMTVNDVVNRRTWRHVQ